MAIKRTRRHVAVKRNNPKAPGNPFEAAAERYECGVAMREAQDVAIEAQKRIREIAQAHYAGCETCQAQAADRQVNRLVASHSDIPLAPECY